MTRTWTAGPLLVLFGGDFPYKSAAGIMDDRWDIPSPDVPTTMVEITCDLENGILKIF